MLRKYSYVFHCFLRRFYLLAGVLLVRPHVREPVWPRSRIAVHIVRWHIVI